MGKIIEFVLVIAHIGKHRIIIDIEIQKPFMKFFRHFSQSCCYFFKQYKKHFVFWLERFKNIADSHFF